MVGDLDDILERLADHPVWCAPWLMHIISEWDDSSGIPMCVERRVEPITVELSSTVTTTRYPVKRKRTAEAKPWPGFDLR